MTKNPKPHAHFSIRARIHRLVAPGLLVLLLASACGMLLRPTSAFDRRMKAASYGTILQQGNADGYDCADSFLVQRDDGKIITLIMKYDGRIRVVE